jgi:UDP-glucose 4-epimerase
MHEEDAASAIALSLEKSLRGVYNVAGPQPLPITQIIRAAGRTPIPVPEPLFRFVIGRFGLPRLPPGALSHLKFPVVVDDSSFRAATGFQHAYDETATIEAYRRATER